MLGDSRRTVLAIRYYQQRSLPPVPELLSLEDGADRVSIRRISGARLEEIRTRLADLNRMRKALTRLIDECEHTGKDRPCPIIATLAADRHNERQKP